MKKLLGITIVAICLASTSASAWTRYGGADSCGMVTEHEGDTLYEASYISWTLGYISGLNEVTQTVFDPAPDQFGIWKAVALHCQKNPLDDLQAAAQQVWFEVFEKQQK
jgi:hypothetical protein